jgi:hypothetical protein
VLHREAVEDELRAVDRVVGEEEWFFDEVHDSSSSKSRMLYEWKELVRIDKSRLHITVSIAESDRMSDK